MLWTLSETIFGLKTFHYKLLFVMSCYIQGNQIAVDTLIFVINKYILCVNQKFWSNKRLDLGHI